MPAFNEYDLDNSLDDSLDDLIGSEPVQRTPLRRPAPARDAYTAPDTHWDVCQKCGGSGSWRGRGTCYACKGEGGKAFKTSAADRAVARDKAHDRKERNTQAWIEEHKAEYAWLIATAQRQTDRINAGEEGWQFPISLCDAITQYGSLTDAQLATVRSCMARDAERKAKWDAERTAREAAAPVVTADKLQAAFDLAREKATRPGQRGVWMRPLVMFAGKWDDSASPAEKEAMRKASIKIEFSPASAKGKNPGAIYAKRGEAYLGKIVAGKWLAARDCTPENNAAVIEVCNDPSRAATTYGKAWGVCCVCSRTLTNEISIARGIGPICAEGYGF